MSSTLLPKKQRIPGGDTEPLEVASGRPRNIKICQIKYAELPAGDPL